MTAITVADPGHSHHALSKPTAERERNPVIDILRGFALFGILLVNFPGSEAARAGGADDAIRRLLTILVSGKFYTTYSFLFGLGFALQLLRAQSRGERIVPVYVRRMLALYLFGFAHFVLIWTGDQLMYYAVMGIFLIFFRNRSVAVLMIVAVLALGAEYYTSITEKPYTVQDVIPHVTDPEQEQPLELQQTLAYRDSQEVWRRLSTAQRYGTYSEAVAARFASWKVSHRYAFRYFWFTCFTMFLLGLYAGRSGLLRYPLQKSVLIARVMLIAGPIWLVLGILTTFGPQVLGPLYYKIPWKMTSLAWTIHEPAGSLFYMSTILVVLSRYPQWIARLAPLGWAGRMGLTNYLMQSVVGTSLYYGYGLGLQTNLGNLGSVLLAALIFSAQIAVSYWWLRYFRFGPCEWAWRSITYLRLQPMRPERRIQPTRA